MASSWGKLKMRWITRVFTLSCNPHQLFISLLFFLMPWRLQLFSLFAIENFISIFWKKEIIHLHLSLFSRPQMRGKQQKENAFPRLRVGSTVRTYRKRESRWKASNSFHINRPEKKSGNKGIFILQLINNGAPKIIMRRRCQTSRSLAGACSFGSLPFSPFFLAQNPSELEIRENTHKKCINLFLVSTVQV